jgi:3-hexulose-6-phosphate synthase
MRPIVQVSLDLTDINEAMEMAHTAMRAGVDWLEAGTPFILAEGLHGVKALRKEFPHTPIVADLKTMDGGYREVMGDNLGCPDMVQGARELEELGCDMVIHHIGYDERRGIAAQGKRAPNPLDQLRDVVDAVSVPVQAVGGLTLEQAIKSPEYGAPLVVIGAPLAIDADSFSRGAGNVEDVLRKICERVHAYGDVPVKGEQR